MKTSLVISSRLAWLQNSVPIEMIVRVLAYTLNELMWELEDEEQWETAKSALLDLMWDIENDGKY